MVNSWLEINFSAKFFKREIYQSRAFLQTRAIGDIIFCNSF